MIIVTPLVNRIMRTLADQVWSFRVTVLDAILSIYQISATLAGFQGSVVYWPRDIPNGLESSSHNERPHPPCFSTGCLPEMGSKDEYKYDNEKDTRCLYGLILVKCREGFLAHRCRINVCYLRENPSKRALVLNLDMQPCACVLPPRSDPDYI